MYRQILVPLDGSLFAEAALPFALSASRRTGAPVHLIAVHEAIPSFAYDEWESAAREWTEQYLDNAAERASERGAGGDVTTKLRRGPVAEEIEAEAEEVRADLVVMATHGRGMLSRTWLGSVADAFLHVTDRPVLLIRPDEGGKEPPDEPTVSQILVPLDGSDFAEDALAHATELGALYDAEYHLVRVVPYAVDIANPYLPHTVQVNRAIVEEAKSAAAEYLEARADRLRARGQRVTTAVVVDAQPGTGILREVEASGSDFVAMATHGRSGLTRAILGSASDKVLRGTHTPLLLHRPEA